MEEWIEAAKRLPKEGATVDVRFGGVERHGVLFSEGRFWQVAGAVTLPAEQWREPPRKGKVINVEAVDGIGVRGKS